MLVVVIRLIAHVRLSKFVSFPVCYQKGGEGASRQDIRRATPGRRRKEEGRRRAPRHRGASSKISGFFHVAPFHISEGLTIGSFCCTRANMCYFPFISLLCSADIYPPTLVCVNLFRRRLRKRPRSSTILEMMGFLIYPASFLRSLCFSSFFQCSFSLFAFLCCLLLNGLVFIP